MKKPAKEKNTHWRWPSETSDIEEREKTAASHDYNKLVQGHIYTLARGKTLMFYAYSNKDHSHGLLTFRYNGRLQNNGLFSFTCVQGGWSCHYSRNQLIGMTINEIVND